MADASTSVTLRGREREQKVVAALLDDAGHGDGGALLISGAPGSGKSALLAAAVAGVGDDATVLSAYGWRNEAGLPFAGLHRMLWPVMSGVQRLPSAQADALQRAIQTGKCEPADQFALSLALITMLRHAAADAATGAPVLCCIDDAQWIDRPSLNALAFATRRIGGHRIAMVFTARPEAADLVPGVPVHRLQPLSDAASRELLADLVPGGIVGDVVEAVVGIAGGSPGALVDLAAALTPEQRRGHAAPPVSLPAESGLRREYEERLDELPEDARQMLLLLGADPDLDVGDLVRAASVAGIGIGALEPAERAGIVRVDGTTPTFAEPLVRGIVYAKATLIRRRWAHRVLADSLDPRRHPLRQLLHRAAVAEGPNPELASALAEAAASRSTSRAAASVALERAAQLTADPAAAATHLVAAARYAWEGGEPNRARTLLRGLRPAEVPDHINAQADLLLGEIELRAGGTNHARQTLLAAAADLELDHDLAVSAMNRAGEAILQSGDYARYQGLAQKALALRRAEESVANDILFEQFAGMTAVFEGRFDDARAPLNRVRELALATDDPAALIRACMSVLLLGDEHDARRLAIRAAAVARANGDHSTVPQALELAAAAEFALGEYDASTMTQLEALPLARATGQASLAASLLAGLGVNAALYGDRATCTARVRQARAQTGAQGAVRPETVIEYALGLLDLVSGRPAEALARLRSLRSMRAGRGQLVLGVAATHNVVDAAMRCGDRNAATEAMAPFEPWALSTGQPIWLAMVARCRALMAEDDDVADHEFQQALHYHAEEVSEFERARTELLFGQALRRRRRRSEAREHLRRAIEGFQLFDTPYWIEVATAELRAAGEQSGPARPEVAEILTPQQLQIARLAAAGATNREVAAALSLSQRTVDHHMRNIFARLDIRSRVELAKLIDVAT
jgi:DNA-binding CsgD family transcriptional regulator